MKKKFLFCLAALSCLLMPIYGAVVNGTCGDNFTWSLNTKDSTLVIEGSGILNRYPWPWQEYCLYTKHVSLPDGVTYIGGRAFEQCQFLEKIVIPDSVTYIGHGAFDNCRRLKSVTLPKSLKKIEYNTFYYCTRLAEICIPDSVTEIGECAFTGCDSLKSIVIPNNVSLIGNRAFYGCGYLTEMTLGSGIESVGNDALRTGITRLTIHATTPPSGAASSGLWAPWCTLYVPEESIETYANSIWWEDFKEIRPIGSSLMVKFVDWNNKTLSFSYVESGEAAAAPANPTREGYTFIGWDKDFTNVTEDLIVTALYEEIIVPTYAIYYNDKEGATIDSEELELHLPNAPEIAGFSFLRWDVTAGQLTDGIVLQAIYTANVPTAASAIYTNPANPAQKLIREGNVYILTSDKTYTITGQEVR